MQKGFTLTELLTVVAIMAIISSIAIPQYQGYTQNASDSIAKNNLRSIYMQQQEYFLDNNVYYFSAATCTDAATLINTNLFDGKTILPPAADGHTYCITQTATTNFSAQAVNTTTAAAFTIDDNNVVNF